MIATAARLNDLGLMRPRTAFFHELLDLNLNQAQFKTNELNENTMFRGLMRLYSPLISQIEGQTAGQRPRAGGVRVCGGIHSVGDLRSVELAQAAYANQLELDDFRRFCSGGQRVVARGGGVDAWRYGSGA